MLYNMPGSLGPPAQNTLLPLACACGGVGFFVPRLELLISLSFLLLLETVVGVFVALSPLDAWCVCLLLVVIIAGDFDTRICCGTLRYQRSTCSWYASRWALQWFCSRCGLQLAATTISCGSSGRVAGFWADRWIFTLCSPGRFAAEKMRTWLMHTICMQHHVGQGVLLAGGMLLRLCLR